LKSVWLDRSAIRRLVRLLIFRVRAESRVRRLDEAQIPKTPASKLLNRRRPFLYFFNRLLSERPIALHMHTRQSRGIISMGDRQRRGPTCIMGLEAALDLLGDQFSFKGLLVDQPIENLLL
jgi:hypothetical protein